MFDFVIGDVIAIEEEYIVIQNNNIGYRVYTSVQSMLDLEIGQKDVLIYTDLIVREDAILLYGFTSQEEVEMFNLLLLVSRVGPKVAIGVLSMLTPNRIKRAVLNEDKAVLCEAPGIGAKTAERMILELRDRVDPADVMLDEDDEDMNKDIVNVEEAISGLTSLGYTRYEVERGMKDIELEGMEVEDIIRVTLKEMSK